MQVPTFTRTENGSLSINWIAMTAATMSLGVAGASVLHDQINGISAPGGTDNVSADADFSDWQPLGLSPIGVEAYQQWMAGFSDTQLLEHVANMEEYAATQPGAGHPYETYHDEYYIARAEAARRGLL